MIANILGVRLTGCALDDATEHVEAEVRVDRLGARIEIEWRPKHEANDWGGLGRIVQAQRRRRHAAPRQVLGIEARRRVPATGVNKTLLDGDRVEAWVD